MRKNWLSKGLVCGIIVLFVGASVVPISCANKNNNCIVYVDDDNTGYMDGSWEHPYRNITDGIKNVCEGGFVYVGNGSYNKCIVIDKPLTLRKTNMVYPGDKQNYLIINGDRNDYVIKIQQNDVTIDGFDIRYSKNKSDYAGIFITGADNCHILNNDLNNNYNGIIIEESTYIYINDNRIHDNQKNGIRISGDSKNIFIENNNKIYLCGENGILIETDNEEENSKIEIINKNYIFSCIGDGIDIEGCSGIHIDIDQNRIYNCGPSVNFGNGIRIVDSSNVAITNNNINNTMSGIAVFGPFYRSNVIINKNNLSECKYNGIYLNGFSFVECLYNNIYRNGLNDSSGAGIYIMGDGHMPFIIQDNSIYGNRINIILGSSFIETGLIMHNNIIDPVLYNFDAFLCTVVNAQNNYWKPIPSLTDMIRCVTRGSLFRWHPCSDHPWLW